MKRYFLVDYENVNDGGLLGYEALKEDDVIILFNSKFSKINEKELEFKKSITKAKILKMTSQIRGKNSLDFQLVSYLGLLIGNDENCEYNIISKDRGFLSAINLILNCTGKDVGFFSCIERKINPKEFKKSIRMINYLKKMFKEKTSIKIIEIIKSSKNKEDAIEKITLHYDKAVINTTMNTLLDYYFDNIKLEGSYEIIIDLLRKNFKRKSCEKIYNIMENSKNKMEALELIHKTFHNVENVEEKVINALDFFYN